jgi:hypothetical protein
MSNSTQFRGGIKSIQRGTISVAVGTTSNTATISTVNTAKTELRFLGGGGQDATPASVFVRIALTNSTTITATIPAYNSLSIAIPVSWELTEWY